MNSITPGAAEGDPQTIEPHLRKKENETQNPVGWFEIPVTDMERARVFYEKTFGYAMEEPIDMNGFTMSFFPMVRDGIGATGSLIQGGGYVPSHEGPLIYFNTQDIPPVEKKIAHHGGKVHKPKFSIGRFGFISICEDSEGNRIALHARS
jgi:predicted enzyme related to lactoylglutathione lyase